MVRVELSKIIIDEKNHDQAVILKEKGGVRQIPIVIGFTEASSIQMRISGVVAPRPMTHDLMTALIASLGADGESLKIDDLVDGTFFARLCLRNKEGQSVSIDCRPSDGIAVAVRLGMPIYANEKIFSQTAANEV
jgi:bifunctional DNase/RNase